MCTICAGTFCLLSVFYYHSRAHLQAPRVVGPIDWAFGLFCHQWDDTLLQRAPQLQTEKMVRLPFRRHAVVGRRGQFTRQCQTWCGTAIQVYVSTSAIYFAMTCKWWTVESSDWYVLFWGCHWAGLGGCSRWNIRLTFLFFLSYYWILHFPWNKHQMNERYGGIAAASLSKHHHLRVLLVGTFWWNGRREKSLGYGRLVGRVRRSIDRFMNECLVRLRRSTH